MTLLTKSGPALDAQNSLSLGLYVVIRFFSVVTLGGENSEKAHHLKRRPFLQSAFS